MEYESKRETRHNRIRAMLLSKEVVTVAEFCETLGCSEATIRNDLGYLEGRGLLKRIFGGAISTGNTAFNAGMSVRFSAFIEEKKAIARYVADRILEPGQTVILDAGSTNVQVAASIVEKAVPLTVVTNSFAAAAILAKSDRVKIYLAGGMFDPATSSFHDETARATVNSIMADIFFFSPNGFSADAGFTVPGPEEALLKQIMLRHARRTIAIGEHTKFDKTAFKIVCGTDQIDMIVTDERVSDAYKGQFKAVGIEVIGAPLSAK